MNQARSTRMAAAALGALAGATLSLGCAADDAATGGGDAAAKGGAVVFTISGEELAVTGYGFPADASGVAFVDGWEVRFDELIVTVDKLRLSESPDLDPGDQSKTGEVVAEVTGPFAVDLAKGGPIVGKGGGSERAVELARVTGQNRKGDAPFAADTRYAFGFDVVAATKGAKAVNLDASASAHYEDMIAKGWAVLYVGTATWRGDGACSPADPAFDALPKTVRFELGFATPTTYVNCQNPDNAPAAPIDGEESQRGIVVRPNQPVTAQLTIHTDHPFWDSSVHDAALHFDHFAAHAAEVDGEATVKLEDLRGVDPTSITSKAGAPLPWRTCTSGFTPPGKGTMGFETGGVAVNPSAAPSAALRDLHDYVTYNQSTQGHLNADGLCYVRRGYPSPP